MIVNWKQKWKGSRGGGTYELSSGKTKLTHLMNSSIWSSFSITDFGVEISSIRRDIFVGVRIIVVLRLLLVIIVVVFFFYSLWLLEWKRWALAIWSSWPRGERIKGFKEWRRQGLGLRVRKKESLNILAGLWCLGLCIIMVLCIHRFGFRSVSGLWNRKPTE